MKAATVAVFGTILHQSFLFDQFPIGSVLSLSLVLIVALQIRTNSGFRSPNLFFSVVILGLLFLFSQSFWQDKMIPANQAGFIWVLRCRGAGLCGGDVAKDFLQAVARGFKT